MTVLNNIASGQKAVNKKRKIKFLEQNVAKC